MISENIAKEQLKRMAQLDYFPDPKQEPQAARELLTALQQSSRSEQHCRRVVDEVMRGTRCPKPAEIRQIAWSLLSDEDQRARGCPRCRGSGWISVTRIRDGVEIDASDFCSCRAAPPPGSNPGSNPSPESKPKPKAASQQEILQHWSDRL
jgi:hypothetical protein